MEKEREMFDRFKTGYKALGVLSDFNALFRVKTADGSPSNIWGHKRTWVLLGALVAGIGPLVAGETGLFGFLGANQECIIMIAVALYALFGAMRKKSGEGAEIASRAQQVLMVQDQVAQLRNARRTGTGAQDAGHLGADPGTSGGGA